MTYHSNPTVLVIEDFPDYGCAWYRSAGVVPYLKDVNWRMPIGSLTLKEFLGVDLIMLNRPHTDTHVSLMRRFLRWNIPVWVDYDDDVFQVNIDNPKYDHWASQKTQDNIKFCAEFAHVVSVTTPHLKDTFDQYNSDVRIIPNGLNDYVFEYQTYLNESKNIVWRGGESHRLDVDYYSDVIIRVMEDHPDWTLHWCGMQAWWLRERVRNFVYHQTRAQDEYMDNLRAIKASIGIVPLLFNSFNEAKSNIALLEMHFAGTAAIVPAQGDFLQDGYPAYTTKESFERLLRSHIAEYSIRRNTYDRQYKIARERVLSKTNEKRMEIIHEYSNKRKN